MKTYYHATNFENLDSIIINGLKPSMEGFIYVTEDPKDSAKFQAIRGVRDILVIPLEVEEGEIVEAFDHNESFFGCKAYGYTGGTYEIDDVTIDGLLRFQL